MVQALLKGKMREAKDDYWRKLEWKLQQNSMTTGVAMTTITGSRSSNSKEAGAVKTKPMR